MKVYSVVQNFDYDGDELRGVFSDRDSALTFIRSRPDFELGQDVYGIIECELNQPVDVVGDVEYV